jgi:hypothetical protein
METLKLGFTLIPADADLNAYNSEWRQKHSQSPPHLQSACNAQVLLDSASKAQCEEELKKLLEAPSLTMAQALRGLDYLNEWKSDETVKDAYREAAEKRWPEATIFQKS